MRNSAKLVMLVAVGASAAFMGCSSSDDSSSSFGGSGNLGGSTAHAGTSSGGTTAQGGTSSGGTTAQGGTSVGGTGVGGTSAGGTSTSGGTGGAAAGTGGAAAGSGGAAAGTGGAAAGSGGAAVGGGGAGGGSNAVVATCPGKTYTPTASPGGQCTSVGTTVPSVVGIANFDAGTAPGWGVYGNAAGGTYPTTGGTLVFSASGANGSAKALAFSVNQDQGIRIEAGFGHMCQDVRTFTGLSFWAKGTLDAYAPYTLAANTLIISLGAEKSGQDGGCTGASCPAAPDFRQPITTEWKQYEIPFNCFGDATVFDGYFTNILFGAPGTMSDFAIDEVAYYH